MMALKDTAKLVSYPALRYVETREVGKPRVTRPQIQPQAALSCAQTRRQCVECACEALAGH